MSPFTIEIDCMTVGELVERLKNMDEDMPIFLSIDPEGNGYSPLDDIWEDASASFQYREIGYREITQELSEKGFSEDDVVSGFDCIVLFPGYW